MNFLVCLGLLATANDIAVLPLTARRIEPEIVRILDDLLTAEVAKRHKDAVISAQDLDAMLNVEQMKDAVGCDDVTCAAEIGGALGTRTLITGSVSVLGDKLWVQLSLIDTQSIRVESRAKFSVPNEESQYEDAIRQSVSLLFKVPANDSVSGARFLLSTVEEDVQFGVSVVTSAGTSRSCASPIEHQSNCTLAGLSTGETVLTVSTSGHNPATRSEEIESASDLFVYRAETTSSLWQRAMYLGGGGTVFAGAAVLGLTQATDADDSGFLTGVGIAYLVIGTGMIFAGRFAFDPDVRIVRVNETDKGWFSATPIVNDTQFGLSATMRW